MSSKGDNSWTRITCGVDKIEVGTKAMELAILWH